MLRSTILVSFRGTQSLVRVVSKKQTLISASLSSKVSEVVIHKQQNTKTTATTGKSCGEDQSKEVSEEEDELEEMFIQGPSGLEWGGPTRGGRRPEPTRYGDWERKGRVSDFR